MSPRLYLSPALGPIRRGHRDAFMTRATYVLFGAAVYVVFLATFVY
jgi:hypothetical protein